MEDYIAELEERAMDGDAEAARELFERYREGDGVEQNDELAGHWYRRAAELRGETVSAPQEEAAAKEEDPVLTEAVSSGKERWKTEEELRRLPYQQQKLAQTEDNPFAISLFARTYLRSAAPEEQRYGCRQLEKANRIGLDNLRKYGASMRDMLVTNTLALGSYYETRTPHESGDAEKAFACYTDAHELDPTQVENLVRCYMNGIGCERDESAAWSLQEKAAIVGGIREQYAIGELLRKSGQSMRAAEWFLSALCCPNAGKERAYAAACRLQLAKLGKRDQMGSLPNEEEIFSELEALARDHDASAALLGASLASNPRDALKLAQLGMDGTPEADALRCAQLAEELAAKLRDRTRQQEEERRMREAAAEQQLQADREAALKARRKREEEKKTRRHKLTAAAVFCVLILAAGGVFLYLKSPAHQYQVRRGEALQAAEARFAEGSYLEAMKSLAAYNQEDAPQELRSLYEKAKTAYVEQTLAGVPAHTSETDAGVLLSEMETLREALLQLPGEAALTERVDELVRQLGAVLTTGSPANTASLITVHGNYKKLLEICGTLPETEAMREVADRYKVWYEAQADALTACDPEDLESLTAGLETALKLSRTFPENEAVSERKNELQEQYVAQVLSRTELDEKTAEYAELEPALTLVGQAKDLIPEDVSALDTRRRELSLMLADWCEKQVAALKKSGKYPEAEDLMKQATALDPGSARLSELYQACQPRQLLDMPVIDSVFFSVSETERTDSYGKVHKPLKTAVFEGYIDPWIGRNEREPYVLFHLDGEYQSLYAQISVEDYENNAGIHGQVLIQDETGRVLYDSDDQIGVIYRDTEPFQIKVDVTGAKNLRFIVKFDGSTHVYAKRVLIDEMRLYP